MKTFIAIILAIILGIALGAATVGLRIAQTPWPGNPPVSSESSPAPSAGPRQPAPKLEVENAKYDFGSMDIDEKASHVFRVRNQGDVLLTIKEDGTSCGCVVSEVDPAEIIPGQSSKITIKWKSRQRLGQFTETASFTTNDPAKPEFTLTITGQVTARIRVVPPELVLNGISANETSAGQVRLLCYQDEPWQILGHQWEGANASSFQATIEPLSDEQLKEEPGAKSGYLIRVGVKPGLPYGLFKQTIRLRTDLKYRPEIIVPVEGSVASDVSIAGADWDREHGVLNLGTVNSREAVRRRVLLVARGPYRKQLKFVPRENPDLPFKLSIGQTTEINNGKVTQTPLTIEIPRGARSADYMSDNPSDWGKITIETTHPQVPEVQIPVRFAVEDKPD
jgi:hypothetical protein